MATTHPERKRMVREERAERARLRVLDAAEAEFAAEGYEQARMHAIADRALEKGTGARGLRSIIEDVMLDIMFDLPDQPKGSSYTIDRTVVEGRVKLFKMPEPVSKSA